jgi:hypothetical protein
MSTLLPNGLCAEGKISRPGAKEKKILQTIHQMKLLLRGSEEPTDRP